MNQNSTTQPRDFIGYANRPPAVAWPGGARVAVGYAQGKSDAEALAAEIDAFAGPGTCTPLHYDLNADAAPQVADLGAVTHFYHFASPRIYRQKSRLYDAALFAA